MSSDDNIIVRNCFSHIQWENRDRNLASFITTYPDVIRMFGRCCFGADDVVCDAMVTPLGYAISHVLCRGRERLLVQYADVNNVCYVSVAGNRRYDAVSLCVYHCQRVECVLSAVPRPCIRSLESAIALCDMKLHEYEKDGESMVQSGRLRIGVLVANLEAIRKCLRIERGIYAVFWAFCQSIYADHSGVFAVIEGVWKLM